MPTNHDLVCDASADRLDRFIAGRLPELTRSYVKQLVDGGQVRLNGRPAKPSQKLRPGDRIAVLVPDPVAAELAPQDIPLHIVYEDEDVLVVDKPAGLTVHPGPGHPDQTLANAILARCPNLAGIKGSVRPGIVHRLDKDTSGLLMVAKNDLSHQSLSQQIKDRLVTKKYIAAVKGRLSRDRGAIDAPIGRDPRNRKRMAVVDRGRPARTEYRVLQRFNGATLVEATLITGRTHQIRVHFSSIGHPVLGDALYGGRWPPLKRQFLHAAELRFRHPRSGVETHCVSTLPADLQAALEGLRPSPSLPPVQGPSGGKATDRSAAS